MFVTVTLEIQAYLSVKAFRPLDFGSATTHRRWTLPAVFLTYSRMALDSALLPSR
ncbi:hypothetical protein ACWEPC_45970 [Nonomuraea sp. NPDC004297]